jgi:uncharacterized protein (DUF885 family)
MGVRTHDRALGDLSLAAMDRQAREAADFLARFERLDTTRLAPAERVTRALLRRELTEAVEGNRFGQRAVLFTTYHGWHTGFANLPDSHPFREPADYEAYVARLAAFPRYNRGAIETTRTAVTGGFAQPCAPLADYEGAISGVTTGEPERSRFLEPFARRPASIDSAAWIALRGRALAAVRDSVYPAYAALLAFYRKEYAPRCRATASIASTPRGADYYAFRVRAETTTELTPEQVHQLGLREVARIGAEMDSVAAQAGHADRAAFVARLRDDPRYYARTPDELLSAAAVLAERLGIEMGLYDTPEKQMGRLSYEMWRATRLVVDPGIHAKGWTREQAIAYMMQHTALSRANIEAEVNRYITWPGQATAYKVGELRIRELRERAERRLGARFTLRAFHDAVLEHGPVPLEVLEAQVERWIASQERTSTSAR